MLTKLQTNTARGEGAVSIIEATQILPFSVARTYHIYGVKTGVVRGHHAHKKLNQFAVCVYGAVCIMLDNGEEKRFYTLDNPSCGIMIPAQAWHTMEWLRDDSVLLVLASAPYDESDYIRNYEDYLRQRIKEDGHSCDNG